MTNPQLTPEIIQPIIVDNLDAIAECFNRCFEGEYLLIPSESQPWEDALGAESLGAGGLSVLLEAGEYWLQVLIPETLPLPSWYKSADASQTARLETLGMEWATLIVPMDLQGGAYITKPESNLLLALQAADPLEKAFWIPIDVIKDETPVTQLQMIFPVRGEMPEPVVNTKPAGNQQNRHSMGEMPGFPMQNSSINRMGRLRPLSVPVSVRLAEKRITLGQLVNIGPGGLITFPKSCEDLLDLYVNNQLYAKGEAVKIGENFGLNINEVGAENVRVSGVFTL